MTWTGTAKDQDSWRDDTAGHQGMTWTGTAKDRDSWRDDTAGHQGMTWTGTAKYRDSWRDDSAGYQGMTWKEQQRTETVGGLWWQATSCHGGTKPGIE